MSSISQQQLELKAQGNQALSNGNAEEAMQFFTQAIDLGGSDSAAKAILYSNRAACHMKLGSFTEALSDAEYCIRLDSDFPKGWSRKASALFSLGKLKEAKDCFEAAATKAKSETDAKSYREWAQKCEEKLPANAPRASASAVPFTVLPIPVMLFRVFSLLLVMYWVFTGDTQSYAFSMYCMLAAVAFQVFTQCGKPKFNTAYLESIVRCDVKPSFYLVLAFSSLAPNLPAVLSVQAFDFVSLARSLNLVMNGFPQYAARLQQYVHDSSQVERLFAVDNWRGMNLTERFRKVDERMDVLGTRFQLSVLLVLFIQLFTPAASPVGLILYSQVIKLRYLTHEQTRMQINTADQYMDMLSQRHPMLNKAYDTVRRGVVYVMKPR